MNIVDHIFRQRLRESKQPRADIRDEFYSDHSRIVFCSSFRRMMKKAQVFSLESNTSVRNRLTHSLEVADIGRSLARSVGRKLEELGRATQLETECLLSIVENACLLHDIGNPAFGHFGEDAIKSWFTDQAPSLIPKQVGELPFADTKELLSDFQNFDGNPQGFRIATRLHSEVDGYGLNLTCSTLLATIKYPHCDKREGDGRLFGKKQGIFQSEEDRYQDICRMCGIAKGKRYFLAYLMELADDICYCLSDIADSFEKRITTSREYKAEIKKICRHLSVDDAVLYPEKRIDSFSFQVAIPIATRVIDEASKHFALNIDSYLGGEAKEISADIESGRLLECLKTFSRQFIYTSPEAQRIEIAGSKIVSGLLDHYGMLLRLSPTDFDHFIRKKEMPKGSKLDIEWRVFNQLSKRMVRVYRQRVKSSTDLLDEWIARARLITDFISGMTDDSARDVYQNFMGISV